MFVHPSYPVLRYSTFSLFNISGSTPIKLVENRSRAARFADWSLSHCSNRHNHRGWLLLRKTRFSGVSPRCYVKDASVKNIVTVDAFYPPVADFLSPFQGFI
jgi:hypothetical protein